MNREIVLEALVRLLVQQLHNEQHSLTPTYDSWQMCPKEPCAAIGAVLSIHTGQEKG